MLILNTAGLQIRQYGNIARKPIYIGLHAFYGIQHDFCVLLIKDSFKFSKGNNFSLTV